MTDGKTRSPPDPTKRIKAGDRGNTSPGAADDSPLSFAFSSRELEPFNNNNNNKYIYIYIYIAYT